MLNENQHNLKQFIVTRDGYLDNEWVDEYTALERELALKSAFKQAGRELGQKLINVAHAACLHVYHDMRTNPSR
jgi:hypothetical protein